MPHSAPPSRSLSFESCQRCLFLTERICVHRKRLYRLRGTDAADASAWLKAMQDVKALINTPVDTPGSDSEEDDSDGDEQEGALQPLVRSLQPEPEPEPPVRSATDMLVAQNTRSNATLGRINCAGGHGLKGFSTDDGGYNCDHCLMDDFPKGTYLRGCTVCDYDVCDECWNGRRGPGAAEGQSAAVVADPMASIQSMLAQQSVPPAASARMPAAAPAPAPVWSAEADAEAYSVAQQQQERRSAAQIAWEQPSAYPPALPLQQAVGGGNDGDLVSWLQKIKLQRCKLTRILPLLVMDGSILTDCLWFQTARTCRLRVTTNWSSCRMRQRMTLRSSARS